MSRPEIKIGSRPVGAGHPVYFIAEAGSNHDGKLDQAKQLIDVAAEAGADAVKFQTFRADSLYPRGAGRSDYLKTERSIYDVIRDLEMPIEWIPALAAHAAERGLHFLSTPFDYLSADALDAYVPAFKIASYEMTHYGLVQHVARKGKPLIISTGTARLDEVEEMIAAVRAVADPGLVVLQCTAKYPAPLSAINVRAIETMAKLGVLTGLSDHSREPLPAPLAAVALGAAVIEKHFTLSNKLPGPDHAYALEPAELRDLIRHVRAVEAALGSGEKVVMPEEQELRAFARRTIFTTRALADGTRVGRADLSVMRCGKLPYGLHPKEFLKLFGRKLTRPLAPEAPIKWQDVGPLRLAAGSVTLRPMERTDTANIVTWRARPDVIGQLFSDAAPTAAAHERWFEALALRTDRVEFVIEDEALGPVGTIGLSGIDFGADRAEYGILLGEPAARGRGLATAASKLLLDYAFNALGMKEVYLNLFADNEKARRLYERLGFVPMGGAPPARPKNGQMRAVLGMSLTAANHDRLQ